MPVSVELARQVLQRLSQHCRGCTQPHLQSSYVYLKYSSSEGGAEQNGPKADVVPANNDGLLNAVASKKPEKSEPSPAPPLREKADLQLVHELLRMEGLSFPPTLEEKAKGKGQRRL